MRLIALIIALMLVMPTFAQRKKKDDEGVTPVNIEGVVYALPRTGIKIHVTAIREKFVPGPYAAYAEDLLGIKNVKTRAESKWMISDVQMETFSEPDPNQVYKAMGYGAALLSLSSNGCIAGINASGNDISAMVTSNKCFQKPDIDDGFSFDYFTDTPTYMQGDSTNNYRPIRVGMEQKVAEAAKRVLDCRMNQYDMAALLMDGEHPDGKAYEVSMKKLKEEEQNYLKLFVGRTTYKTEECSFDFVPESAGKSGQVAFRISDENGIVPASDLSGKPVQVEFDVASGLSSKYATKATPVEANAGTSGIYYRMPGVATVHLIYQMKELASMRTTIAQFGEVAPLSEYLLDGDYAIEFHPETGAVKSIKYITAE
jgi:hypothetical protein